MTMPHRERTGCPSAFATVRYRWRNARGLKFTATVLLIMGVCACGSTVAQGPLVPGSQGAMGVSGTVGSGVGGSGGGSLGSATGATSLQRGQSGSAGPGAVTSASGGGPGSTSLSGSGSAADAGTARGVTAAAITVGIPLPSDTTAVANALGIKGAGTVPPQDMVAAVINDINRSGGVLGRKLVDSEHSYSIATYTSNPAQTDAEICSDYRDDHKVFSIIFNVVDDYLRQCAAAMGSPFVIANGNQAYLPAADYQANGGNFLFGPTAITAERLAHLFVQSLMARSFTRSWNILSGGPGATPSRLGVIHVDTPDQDAYYADIGKELARYGLKFTDTFTYSRDLNDAVSGTQSAVLKFKADGITHVFGASAVFMDDAESQKYYPRYAYLPGLGALGAQNVPADEMNGALTVGWAPAIDVAAQQDPGDTPGARHCRAVMTKAGLSVSNRSDLETMYSICDALYMFRAALDAGGSPTAHALQTGFESLGTSFPTALSFNAHLGPARHYGIDSVRDVAWDSNCGCLKYTSRTNRS